MSTYEATDADLDAIAAVHAAQELALARDTLRLRTEALHRAIKRASEAMTREVALRSGIEALAFEWHEAQRTGSNGRHGYHASEYGDLYADDLRALLAPPSTPSSPTGTRAASEGMPGGSEAQEAPTRPDMLEALADELPTFTLMGLPVAFVLRETAALLRDSGRIKAGLIDE